MSDNMFTFVLWLCLMFTMTTQFVISISKMKNVEYLVKEVVCTALEMEETYETK